MDLVERDLQHIWHPCSQMQDYESFPPMAVKSAQGPYIELENGHQLIDATSSWWCKNLGHGEPRIKQAVAAQMERFEHVILANTTNATLVDTSEKIAQLCAPLNKVFYASDGASAVEIAIKMSLQAQQLAGRPERTLFVGLENSYHGETMMALSVSDVDYFKKPFAAITHPCDFLGPLPYVSSTKDPLWEDCSSFWPAIEAKLEALKEKLCAIVIEPILQGSGYMKIYSKDFLRRLSAWAQAHHVYLIADEILTGLGRTGKDLACQHAGITPDFICLGKSLTAGWLAMSAVVTRDEIYDLFYGDYSEGKTFFHSHTYSGNALAAAAAGKVLDILKSDHLYERVTHLEKTLHTHMQTVVDETKVLTNLRYIGGVVAADLKPEFCGQRLSHPILQEAVKRGALLRPLGDTIYWLPPLNCEFAVIEELRDITIQAIHAVIPANTTVSYQANVG